MLRCPQCDKQVTVAENASAVLVCPACFVRIDAASGERMPELDGEVPSGETAESQNGADESAPQDPPGSDSGSKSDSPVELDAELGQAAMTDASSADGVERVLAGARDTVEAPSRAGELPGGVERRLEVHCPNSGCAGSFWVPPHLAGRRARCNRCEASFVVPQPNEDNLIDAEEANLRRRRHGPFQEGQVVGDYQIRETVGLGGMGAVYRACHAALGHEVALKVLLAGDGASDRQVERFFREARANARLTHPSIVALREFGRTPTGLHYFTMDFIEGRSLRDVLRGEGLSPDRAAETIEAIALAIDYAHGEGVIHRDIKPGNIMFRADGTPVVMDFGLAKTFDEEATGDLSLTGMVMGTLRYMPPEQAAGRVHDIDVRSDVYALGAILYELLTGRPPFVREGQYQLIRAICEEEIIPPGWLNPAVRIDLQTICLTCLERDPERRYPTARTLGADLRRFLEHRPIAASPAGWGRRTRRFIDRNRALCLSTVAVVVAMALGLGMALHQMRVAQRALLVAEVAKVKARDALASYESEHTRAEEYSDLAEEQGTRADEAAAQASEASEIVTAARQRVALEAERCKELYEKLRIAKMETQKAHAAARSAAGEGKQARKEAAALRQRQEELAAALAKREAELARLRKEEVLTVARGGSAVRLGPGKWTERDGGFDVNAKASRPPSVLAFGPVTSSGSIEAWVDAHQSGVGQVGLALCVESARREHPRAFVARWTGEWLHLLDGLTNPKVLLSRKVGALPSRGAWLRLEVASGRRLRLFLKDRFVAEYAVGEPCRGSFGLFASGGRFSFRKLRAVTHEEARPKLKQ